MSPQSLLSGASFSREGELPRSLSTWVAELGHNHDSPNHSQQKQCSSHPCSSSRIFPASLHGPATCSALPTQPTPPLLMHSGHQRTKNHPRLCHHLLRVCRGHQETPAPKPPLNRVHIQLLSCLTVRPQRLICEPGMAGPIRSGPAGRLPGTTVK